MGAREALGDGVPAPGSCQGLLIPSKGWKSPPDTAAMREGWAGLGYPCLVSDGAGRAPSKPPVPLDLTGREKLLQQCQERCQELSPALQDRELSISSCCRNVGPTPVPAGINQHFVPCPAHLCQVGTSLWRKFITLRARRRG